jgi:hypothetical protein
VQLRTLYIKSALVAHLEISAVLEGGEIYSLV